MRILYIAPYTDNTGYAHAALGNLEALSLVADVTARPIKFNNHRGNRPKWLSLLENKSGEFDCVIQHYLPAMFQYDSRAGLNIGCFHTETTHFKNSGWARNCNLMDVLFVTSQHSVDGCLASGVHKPVFNVPVANNLDKFTKQYKVFPALAQYKKQKKFIFYTIGELVRRKNYVSLLRAYWTEFCHNDDVVLVVKTNIPGQSSEEAKNQFNVIASDVKEALHFGAGCRLPEVVLLTDTLTEQEMCQLHVTGDCFVTASHGEGWCHPAMDAMGFGKTPVVPAWGGFFEYLNEEVGFFVDGSMSSCFGAMDSAAGLYCGNEEWFTVNTVAMGQAMRRAMSLSAQERLAMASAGIDRAWDFAPQKVGKFLLSLLGRLYHDHRTTLAGNSG